jgi:light-regulated signal transduction histidine kinase (bacteriophytochrome)
MHLESVDLSRVASRICTALQQAHPNQQVDFAIQPGLRAQADPQLLQVVLENLLNNAWKFTSKHPQARIEFGAISQANDIPIYFVRDDGVGFDMTYTDKLFGPFQRLHSMQEFPGNGIGLATVQRIVHRHGGRVWAEGAVERGATIYFTLAAEEVEAGV